MLQKTDVLQYGAAPRQTPVITGRAIAHGKLSKGERALGAAQQHLDRLHVASPTIKQVADTWCVSVPYIQYGIQIIDDPAACADVLAGVPIYKVAGAANGSETLAEHIARATPKERLQALLEAAREMGPAAVWDHLIIPFI